ncbi:MAG: alanine--glyoxylate aminotransferase family protein [Chloroflexi bacterium]|nr:alanine--glyoxylate aminotransferase family protein [Chloroflexota bacterium]
MKVNLRIPGPTPCPDDVLEAMGHSMINHRGPEFKELSVKITERLKKIFETKNDLLILTTSGTGGLEAAVVNTLSPGDKVLVVSIGYFGDRFAECAQIYGAQVIKLDFPWGTAADPDQIRQALRNNPEIKAVLVTHNETSTGVTNDLEAISGVVKGEFDKLLLVDAVSSIGSIPLPVDEWRCDVVVTGSQKGWMTPPGLAFVSFSEQAWKAYSQSKIPRYYFDMKRAKNYYERGQTPWTPAVSVYYGLDVALDRILAEGMPNIFKRQARMGQMVRDGAKSLGLSIFPREEVASNTVTAVKIPQGVDAKQLLKLMDEQRGVVMAGGQQSLEGKIFRIGHMGYCEYDDIQQVLDGLKATLPKVGFQPSAVGR